MPARDRHTNRSSRWPRPRARFWRLRQEMRWAGRRRCGGTCGTVRAACRRGSSFRRGRGGAADATAPTKRPLGRESTATIRSSRLRWHAVGRITAPTGGRRSCRVELPRWTIYERGGGGATKRAAQAWLAGSPPWQSRKTDVVRRYFDAGGNGVAMRVLPHALFLAEQDDPAVLVHDVVRDGAATHGHPRALVGATACGYAAWSLVRRNRTLEFGELLDLLIDEHGGWGAFPDMERGAGAWFAAANRVFDQPYERLWERTVGEMRQLLEQARNGIRAGALADDRAVLDDLGCFGRSKGAGTVTAAAAAYLAARHAAQPAQGVLRAAFERGADTDTLAAMTGGAPRVSRRGRVVAGALA